jgi:hypothetical protein
LSRGGDLLKELLFVIDVGIQMKVEKGRRPTHLNFNRFVLGIPEKIGGFVIGVLYPLL